MSGQIVWAQWAYLDGSFQPDSGVYVEESTIVEVGSYDSLKQRYPNASVVGGTDYLMLPGLINSHDHGRALGTVSLGVPDSFLEVWLTSLGSVPRLSPRLTATYEGIQLIRSGVTGVAHSHNPASYDVMFDEIPQSLQGYREAGVRVAMYPTLLDQNTLVYDEADKFLALLPDDLHPLAQARNQMPNLTVDDYFRELDGLFEQHHDVDSHWVHIQVSPVGGQWVSDDFILRAVDWAKAHETRVQMHMLESGYQRQYAFRKWNKGFIQHLDDIGALGDWLTLAHMIYVEDGDAELLAERGVNIAHNASSNLRLRCGIAPIPTYLEAGVNVGIGLDGHGLDDDQDYLREMRLVFTLANRPDVHSADISPTTVLDMGSRNGAKATFGKHSQLGTLSTGKLADVVLLDWEAVKGAWCPPNFPTREHLPEFFLRRANRQHVSDVMVNGEWFLRDGEHTHVDEEEVHRTMQEVYASQSPPQQSPLASYVRQHYQKWDRL